MRKSRRKPKQPAADDSNATPRPQTSQSKAVISPQPRTTIPPQPPRPAEQQQPQRSGTVTRSSRLAPIEKQRGRTFPKEEPRQRCSSLGAGEKKRRRRKGEPLSIHGGLLALPTRKVGLSSVVQVANQVTLHNPSNPPSGTEATAAHHTQQGMSRQEDPGELNNRALDNFSESVPQETEEERPTETPQHTSSSRQGYSTASKQPRHAGPITRSSRLAPIEKRPGRTFSREEARKRSSSLGAPSKGKKTTRKTEAQLLAPSTQEVGLGEVLQVAPVTLQDPTDPPSGTEATAVERTQTEMSCDEDPDESNNAALEDFSESLRQATLVQLWESASCCRNNETPNCRTRPEECERNEVEQFFLEELYDMHNCMWHCTHLLKQSYSQPQTYTLSETDEQWIRQELLPELEDRLVAVEGLLELLPPSVQARIQSELSCRTNLERQTPSSSGYSILTDDEERDGEDYSDLDPDEDWIPMSDDETETSNVSITTRSHAYRTLKSSAQYQGSLSNQQWEDQHPLEQDVDSSSRELRNEQELRAEMFTQAEMGCDGKLKRRCRDHAVALDLPEWYERPTRQSNRKRKVATSDSSGPGHKKLVLSAPTKPPASFYTKPKRLLANPQRSPAAWLKRQSPRALDEWPQSWNEHHFMSPPPKVPEGKQEVVSNQSTAEQAETSLFSQPQPTPSASYSLPGNHAHTDQPLFRESNLVVRDELNNAVYKTHPKPLHHSRLGTDQINSMALHRSSPQTCRESRPSHTPQLIASTASDVHYSKSTARPKHPVTKPATLELAGKKSKTITKTSKVMAAGREIVANLPGRTPMKIGNNNFFKDSIKKKRQKTRQVCQYLKYRDRLASKKAAHTDSLSDSVSRGRDTHEEGGEDVCTAGTTENPRRDSHEEGGGSPNGHPVERKSLILPKSQAPTKKLMKRGEFTTPHNQNLAKTIMKRGENPLPTLNRRPANTRL